MPREVSLPDVHGLHAEVEQSLQLGVLVAIGRVQVEVQPVLARFGPSGTRRRWMPHAASADGLIDTTSASRSTTSHPSTAVQNVASLSGSVQSMHQAVIRLATRRCLADLP